MFLTGLCVGMFIGANVGVVIAGLLLRAKLERRDVQGRLDLTRSP